MVDVLLHDPRTPAADLTSILARAGLPVDVRTTYGLRAEARTLTGTLPAPREDWTFTGAVQRLGVGKRRLRWITAELGMPEPSGGPVRRWPAAQWRQLLHRLDAKRSRRP